MKTQLLSLGLLRTTILVGCATVLFVQNASAQEAQLRRTLDGTPTIDENLNGVEDSRERDAPRQPQVVFSEPIETETTGDENSTDRDEQNANSNRTINENAEQRTRGINRLRQRADDVEGNPRVRRQPQVGLIGPNGEISPLANRRVEPVQSGRARSTDDPYAPIGIRTGSFTWFPTITQTFGATNNADFAKRWSFVCVFSNGWQVAGRF